MSTVALIDYGSGNLRSAEKALQKAASGLAHRVDIATTGEVRAFTIVSLAAPGIPVPFVAAVVDCDGTSVRGNVVTTEPDPDPVHVGMKVRLTTQSIGTDSAGTEAIGFGFEPIGQ